MRLSAGVALAFASLALPIAACGTTAAPGARPSEAPSSECDPRGKAKQAGVPDRCETIAAMKPLMDDIRLCAMGSAAIAQVLFDFVSDGHVHLVQVAPNGFDPSVVTCIETYAARALIAPFSRPTFRVSFPFVVGAQQRR